MAARRLPFRADPAPNPPRRRVRVTFDGEAYEGFDGEPLAVTLLAADRPILSRSFRFHRPRGLMCSTGQCGWCECEVDGRPSVRSCQVPVRDGLVARGEHAWPSVGRDVFGWLDVGSRWVTPTFYHHRFLRPRALRKRYLDVIRGFGGRGRLGTGRASEGRTRVARELDVDVLVVGGGRAGVAAAQAATAGGDRVAIVEAVSGRARPAHPDIRVLDGAAAAGWYDGVVTAIDDDTLWSIRAGSVIAATGSYERVPSVRGADRPGVIGARLALALIEEHRVLPGERPVLIGEAGDLEKVGAAFAAEGVRAIGPFQTAALRRVLGRRRVSGAIIERDGRHRRAAADVVVFGDRTPNLDLVLAAGAAAELRDGVLTPVHDEAGRTTVPGLSVVGSAAGRVTPPSTPAVAPPGGRTLVCFCEDVHADEIHAQVAAGCGDPELVKRRTGALTGPCQGKYCLQSFSRAMAAGGAPLTGPPTARPPLRPTRLGDLVPSDDALPSREPPTSSSSGRGSAVSGSLASWSPAASRTSSSSNATTRARERPVGTWLASAGCS
jgi:sarcosine oxidase subunit alpha